MTSLLRRSELAVPAANDHMFAKAAASEADLVFLDLEDATAPAHKEAARGKAIKGAQRTRLGPHRAGDPHQRPGHPVVP